MTLKPINADWHDWFRAGESPYFSMFRCGVNGIPLDEVSSYCLQLDIPLREKDINSYIDGKWKFDIKNQPSIINPIIPKYSNATQAALGNLHFDDFKHWPSDWNPTEKRWFPCTADNRPMQKWGYKEDYIPYLYTRAEAIALAPTGFVGQNMLGQRFVVIDIDGEGHGERDEQVIAWGSKYRDRTESWSDPTKPGSFHLYFWCSRQVPVMHFNYAKIDLIGNAVNAAVCTKTKSSNGIQRAFMTAEIWEDLMAYVRMRKEQR